MYFHVLNKRNYPMRISFDSILIIMWKKFEIIRRLAVPCVHCCNIAFMFFHMLAIRFYWNDNQRIELVNWCILIFRLFRYSAVFSIQLARLFVVVVVFSLKKKNRRQKRRRMSRFECMQWEHAIDVRIKLIQNTHTRL